MEGLGQGDMKHIMHGLEPNGQEPGSDVML